MIKPLLKITFVEPYFIVQHGLWCKSRYLVSNEVVKAGIFIKISGNTYPKSLIKSIEFINPNEL